MLKGTMEIEGKKVLMVGLSFANLDKFRRDPRDTFIRIKGDEMGIPFDVMIFSGETEAHMADFVKGAIGPTTIVHIDPKLKS